jgi:hypothetical protein
MRDRIKLAEVKQILREIAEIAPGKSVELRVPPYAAVQVVDGPTHRRGTPPSVVELDEPTLILLVTGELSWAEAIRLGRISASGERSDLSWLFEQYKVRRSNEKTSSAGE